MLLDGTVVDSIKTHSILYALLFQLELLLLMLLLLLLLLLLLWWWMNEVTDDYYTVYKFVRGKKSTLRRRGGTWYSSTDGRCIVYAKMHKHQIYQKRNIFTTTTTATAATTVQRNEYIRTRKLQRRNPIQIPLENQLQSRLQQRRHQRRRLRRRWWCRRSLISISASGEEQQH